MFIISCLFLWAESLVAFTHPRVRNLEVEIPDAISEEAEEQAVSPEKPSDGEAAPLAGG
jgi:hypothetical protein